MFQEYMVHSDFTMQDYSNQDFLRLIEHRIRKEIRQNDFISLKKSYQLKEQTTLQSQVLLYFLKQIFHERLDLSAGELITTDYLELFILKKLQVFLDNKNPDILLEKSIIPFRCITEHEMLETAKILSLKGDFTPVNQEMISSLQKKYPQSKPSFLKSFSSVEKLQKK